MTKHLFFALLSLFGTLGLSQPELPTFSELSGKPLLFSSQAGDFTSVVTDSGIIYSFVASSETSTVGVNRFYLIDFDGQLVDSTEVFSGLAFGDLFEYQGRYFYAGMMTLPDQELPPGERAFKVLVEFDDDLSIVNYKEWPGVFPLSGVSISGATAVGGGTAGSFYSFYGIHRIEEDTLFGIFHYLPQVPGFPMQLGQIEKLGINHDYAEVVRFGGSQFTSACITDNYFYAFGMLGGFLDQAPVLRYAKDGTFLDAPVYDPQAGIFGYGGLFSGSLVQYHQGRLYCTFSDQGNPIEGGTVCQGAMGSNPPWTAVIDIRDEEFNLIKRAELPACYGVPTGNAPFSFAPDGNIYYTTLIAPDFNYPRDDFSLFKFDEELNEIWRLNISNPGSRFFPRSSKVLPDGSILIETSDFGKLALFRVSADGEVITSSTLPFNVGLPPPTFHPNPFTNELSLLAPPERPLRVDVFGMDGRAHGSYRAQEGRLQLGHLPGGAYVLRVSDVESGRFLGAQRVVKVGR